MYNRLSNFIEKMNIIYAKQFGFRLHHSTEHAILSIVVIKYMKGLKRECSPVEYFLILAKHLTP